MPLVMETKAESIFLPQIHSRSSLPTSDRSNGDLSDLTWPIYPHDLTLCVLTPQEVTGLFNLTWPQNDLEWPWDLSDLTVTREIMIAIIWSLGCHGHGGLSGVRGVQDEGCGMREKLAVWFVEILDKNLLYLLELPFPSMKSPLNTRWEIPCQPRENIDEIPKKCSCTSFFVWRVCLVFWIFCVMRHGTCIWIMWLSFVSFSLMRHGDVYFGLCFVSVSLCDASLVHVGWWNLGQQTIVECYYGICHCHVTVTLFLPGLLPCFVKKKRIFDKLKDCSVHSYVLLCPKNVW